MLRIVSAYNDYTPDLDTFMSKAMASLNDKSEDKLNLIKIDFSEAMKLSHATFGEEAFRKIYKDNNRLPPINKALFDAIATQFALLNDNNRQILKTKKALF